ncbi:cytochrome c oxidase subunit 3 [Thermonema rossianum]|uniref:cytochrome c oxidase subunit 3 n=1 Tax=Thermonema rossianum TaxID=55505 RepID=UPI00056FB195|nr:cytochrome c oxidase subunit 3 [Thermonema rossianum]
MENKRSFVEKISQRREPLSFMLWLGLIGISIMFVFLSAIFLKYRLALPTLPFEVPRLLGISTFVILCSSLTLQQAYKAFLQDAYFAYRYLLGTTFLLAMAFGVCQWIGWESLYQQNLELMRSTPLHSLFFVMVLLHLAHVGIGGLVLLYFFGISLLKLNYVDAFIYAMNPPNRLFLRLLVVYWHFIGGIWLYLYIFFQFM